MVCAARYIHIEHGSRTPHITRAGILSVVGSIYNPLGFLRPVILPAKQILQDLCRAKLGWDEQIHQDVTHALEDTHSAGVLLQTLVKWQQHSCIISATAVKWGTLVFRTSAFIMGQGRVSPLFFLRMDKKKQSWT